MFGDAGAEKPPDADGVSVLRLLMASACRFGGPRRRLGLSNVHGMSNAEQARHGGPDSSHCGTSLTEVHRMVLECLRAYSDLAYAARVARLAQSIALPSRLLCPISRYLLRVLGMVVAIGMSVVGLWLDVLIGVEGIRLMGRRAMLLLLLLRQ